MEDEAISPPAGRGSRREKESGREENKGVQEDDFRRQQPAQTRKDSLPGNQ